MKQFFFRHPTASFVQGNGRVFAYVHPVDEREEELMVTSAASLERVTL
jgi:hypothetical protein